MIVLSVDTSCKAARITCTDKEYDDLKQLVARATNTWEQAPQWVKDLNDTLQDVPSTI